MGNDKIRQSISNNNYLTLFNENKELKSSLELLQNDNVNLRHQINDLNKSIEEQKQKEIQEGDRVYVMNKVKEYNPTNQQTIMISDNVKQNLSDFGDSMDIHINRLKEWN